MSLARSGYSAHPLVCPDCGSAVQAPSREQALLDERGWAHVPCECGRVNVVPFEEAEIELKRRKPRRPSWQLAALWIVIVALIAFLMPIVREPDAEPEPPSYLVT